MAHLNNCPHCGAETGFITNSQGTAGGVFAQCTGCKIQTQTTPPSLDYSAKDKVAAIWNSSQSEEWADWMQPKGAYDAYSKGSKVNHTKKLWISNLDTNVCEPGVSGWTERAGGTL